MSQKKNCIMNLSYMRNVYLTIDNSNYHNSRTDLGRCTANNFQQITAFKCFSRSYMNFAALLHSLSLTGQRMILPINCSDGHVNLTSEAIRLLFKASQNNDAAGDATWILTSAFIIFTMQSGFGLLEAGKCKICRQYIYYNG